MQIAIQRHFFHHLPLERPRAAADVAQPHASDAGHETMENRPPQRLELSTGTRVTVPNGNVCSIHGSSNELGDLGCIDLMVGGQRYDEIARSSLEAGHEGGGFPKTARQAHHRDPLAGGEQSLEISRGLRAPPIEDEYELKPQA